MQSAPFLALLLASLAAPVYGTFWGWGGASPVSPPTVKKAVVVLQGTGTASGIVYFEQPHKFAPVKITGNLTGLDANSLRGFHVHQAGDTSQGCGSAGPHFNPLNKKHGGPTDKERHVGDLGNIQTNEEGVAILDFQDKVISLNGPFSIVGRAVVLHAGTDDLGRGGHNDSLTTGNAGGRSACGVVAIVE
ncbi:Cu/Zn superoxide dismutase [Coprinopsis cinerea AmutBmut pab1-1]|nr:Cu/Zn superoxide dismutase [Coprinopsis cinerea AmutBmut pab1-1]